MTRLAEQHRMAVPWVLDTLEQYARYPMMQKRVTPGAQQGEHRIGSLERGVNHRSKTGITFALGIHHIHDQHLGFTPCPRIAPAPFLGLRASFGLTQPQASAITADHHPTSRHG